VPVLDTRFSIKYSIEPPHPEGQLFYFKLFMNGRNITSWGIDPKTQCRGVVSRALFDAHGWDYEDGDGQLVRNEGTEVRPFLFSSKQAATAADDGGYIEIRVFRAKGKVRVAPKLEPYRLQEDYGLMLVLFLSLSLSAFKYRVTDSVFQACLVEV
jgi:hypothetical protein